MIQESELRPLVASFVHFVDQRSNARNQNEGFGKFYKTPKGYCVEESFGTAAVFTYFTADEVFSVAGKRIVIR